ncbi:retrovirus-related pol polyprotein from transposon TNT 1-94 [Tanacetum coccineum]
MEADDQTIETIIMGLLEDIYVAVDSCETTQKIWLRVQQMMKGYDIGIQELHSQAQAEVNGNGNRRYNIYACLQLQKEWSILLGTAKSNKQKDVAYLQTQLLLHKRSSRASKLQALRNLFNIRCRLTKLPTMTTDGSAENDSNVISAVSSVEHWWRTLEQRSPATQVLKLKRRFDKYILRGGIAWQPIVFGELPKIPPAVANSLAAFKQGPVRARVLNDLSAEEKERYKADIRATNILLQGLLKDIYSLINHYTDAKDIWENMKMILEGSELTKDAMNSQHEVHANENRIMKMERFLHQPNNDPLALMSVASVQQYPTQSSKSPQPLKEPSPADNFQLDLGSSSIENLIESLSNTLALLTQSNNARGNGVAGNVGAQNRGGMTNPGQAKPIKYYNCNGLGHIARKCPRPKRLQDSDYFKDKMLLMQAQESGAVLDEEQSLFLAGEQVTNVDDDVDDSPENDLALNVDHNFEADECDAFDSDVDEGPTSQTMFIANLTSKDPIYDEAGPSYDSNNPFEVQDQDTFVDHMDEYHEVHEMQNDVQHNYVVDSDADYTSDSNIIPYDQYVEDNEEHVVQCNASSVRNDALMSILNEMHE